MTRARTLGVALLVLVACVGACERIVDLTPPDAGTGTPDAAVFENGDAVLFDAVGSDGAVIPPDVLPDAT